MPPPRDEGFVLNSTTPSEDAYWVVTVDRATGRARTELVVDADTAHTMAIRANTASVFATVVGRR